MLDKFPGLFSVINEKVDNDIYISNWNKIIDSREQDINTGTRNNNGFDGIHLHSVVFYWTNNISAIAKCILYVMYLSMCIYVNM